MSETTLAHTGFSHRTRPLRLTAALLACAVAATGCAATDAVQGARDAADQVGQVADTAGSLAQTGAYAAAIAGPLTEYARITSEVIPPTSPTPACATQMTTAAGEMQSVHSTLAAIKPGPTFAAPHASLAKAVAATRAAQLQLAGACRNRNPQQFARAQQAYAAAQQAVGTALEQVAQAGVPAGQLEQLEQAPAG